MTTRHDIEEFARRIADEFHPERIILFGSYAYGTPTQDSDVDLLVVMPVEGQAVHKAIEIRLALDAPFPLDLLVRDPDLLRQRLEWGDFFLREVIEKGETLYESADRGVGAKS